MTNSERLSHTLVAIPIAHVLGSAFYLFSYCLGFGANLVAHASATDLFSVSINDMVPVYFYSLILPMAVVAVRLSSVNPYAADAIKELPIESQNSAVAKMQAVRKAITFTSIIVPIVVLILISIELWNGGQFSYRLLWIGLLIPSTAIWMNFCESCGFSNAVFESGALISGFVVALLCIGASKGQSDRFISYDTAQYSNTLCSDAIVLRQLSGKFLAIMPDNSRALISDDCRIKFSIPDPSGNSPYAEDQVDNPNPETGETVKSNPPTAKK